MKTSWLLLFLTTTMAFNLFNLRLFSTKSDAVCLDGSPAGFYYYQPDDLDKSPNKLLIVFEWQPKGWCFRQDLNQSLFTCDNWRNQDIGSSAQWPTNFIYLKGILSSQSPGQFANWRKVYIKGCDGGSYIGNSVIKHKSHNLYFRGSRNVEETINALNKMNYLKNREEIVVAGTYDAGIAAVQWSQVIQKNTNGKVRVLADAAFYLNDLHYKDKRSLVENRLRSLQKLVLTNTSLPHKACAAKNANQLWKCFFMEQLASLTNIPIFFTQSLYDGFHIEQILGIQCTAVTASLSQCPKQQKQAIVQYHNKMRTALNSVLAAKSEFGVFGISCVEHTMFSGNYNYELFQVPMNSGQQPWNGIQKWVRGQRIRWMDEVEWPHNTPCSRKALLQLSIEDKQKSILHQQ